MSIEAAFASLTTAVEALTAAVLAKGTSFTEVEPGSALDTLNKSQPVVDDKAAKAAEKAAAKAAKAAEADKEAALKAEAEKAQTTINTAVVEPPATETPAAPPAAPPATDSTIDINAVRVAVKAYSSKHGRDAAVALMTKYGAPTIPAIPPANYPALIAEANGVEEDFG